MLKRPRVMKKPFLLMMLLLAAGTRAEGQSLSEGFNNVPNLPANWVTTNNSTRSETGTPWNTGSAIVNEEGNAVVAPYEGAGFAIAQYTSVGSGSGTISNWLISPALSLNNGDTFSFFTTTLPTSAYADRLELRLSLNGASTDVGETTTSVGDFTTLLLTINPGLAVGGYPVSWTQYSATVSGLTSPTTGRFAFRYFVTSGGPSGANSDIIGVDAVQYTAAAVPEPATYALLFGGVFLLAALSLKKRVSFLG